MAVLLSMQERANSLASGETIACRLLLSLTSVPYREHVLAVVVQPSVMEATQPTNSQGLIILLVMGVNGVLPANLTGLLFQRA